MLPTGAKIEKTYKYGDPASPVAVLTLGAVLLGFLSLMFLISKGRPQAGLPFLNGAAIIGFAVAYLLVYRDLGFGFA
jgi:presenilin-like A22 family membrane protease